MSSTALTAPAKETKKKLIEILFDEFLRMTGREEGNRVQ
jgi:hypothetical protein